MRYYELMFISDPALEEGFDVIKQKIEGIVGSHEGSIDSFDKLGKKRLAYPISKRLYGIYNLVNFQGYPSVVSPLETFLRLNSQVFRHIILVFTEKTLKLRTETKRIQEEEDERMRRGGRPTYELTDKEKERITSQNITPISANDFDAGVVGPKSDDSVSEEKLTEPDSSQSTETSSGVTTKSEKSILDADSPSAPDNEDIIKQETAE